VPYRTDAAAPTMETLRSADGERAFPIALEPVGCTRFEMASFALAARDLGVRTSRRRDAAFLHTWTG